MADQLDIGLALSGGGYRAMLFGLGSVWRLNELGWLRKLDIITSVSGGSILNGVLATRWPRLAWSSDGVATNFIEEVVNPVQSVAGVTLDVSAGVSGLLSIFDSISDKVVEGYDDLIFNGVRLQDTLAFDKGKTPRFLFYATSLQTGSSVRIERKRLADYRIGEIPAPNLSVARVVAASSAFPPVLSPVAIEVDPDQWKWLEGAYLFDRIEFKKRLLLTDGGVYDNMGLEAIANRCGTVLVADAGAPLEADADPPTDWTRQAVRVLDIVTEQTRALRRRALLDDLTHTPPSRKGTYWGIRTKIGDYGLRDALCQDSTDTVDLQNIRTRLNAFSAREQGQLINWGYALTDAAMRRWVVPSAAPSSSWPIPKYSL